METTMRLWTPWIVLPLGLLLMAGVIAAAFTADSIRLRDELRTETATVEQELLKLEDRFAKLDGSTASTAADDPDHATFRARADRFRSEAATGPNAGKHRDELAGIVNRWEIVATEYRRLREELRAYERSLRGRTAEKFAPGQHVE
jgi:hypothetical protein